MNPRIAPAAAPFSAVIEGWLEKTMPPGMAPLSLFTTLARDERLLVDACWGAEDQVLIRLCDSLHGEASVGDELWESLRSYFGEQALLELLLLAGYYRAVSYLTSALRLTPEPKSASFPIRKGLR